MLQRGDDQQQRTLLLSEGRPSHVSLLQAEESGKLAAQKEARLARQRLAQAQVSGPVHM